MKFQSPSRIHSLWANREVAIYIPIFQINSRFRKLEPTQAHLLFQLKFSQQLQPLHFLLKIPQLHAT